MEALDGPPSKEGDEEKEDKVEEEKSCPSLLASSTAGPLLLALLALGNLCFFCVFLVPDCPTSRVFCVA